MFEQTTLNTIGGFILSLFAGLIAWVLRRVVSHGERLLVLERENMIRQEQMDKTEVRIEEKLKELTEIIQDTRKIMHDVNNKLAVVNAWIELKRLSINQEPV